MKPIRELEISGCWELQQFRFADERGVFAKAYHTSDLQKHELSFEVREVFWSMSGKGNIRGMHFQIPPHHHHKLVSCQQGKILDAIWNYISSNIVSGIQISRCILSPTLLFSSFSISMVLSCCLMMLMAFVISPVVFIYLKWRLESGLQFHYAATPLISPVFLIRNGI